MVTGKDMQPQQVPDHTFGVHIGCYLFDELVVELVLQAGERGNFRFLRHIDAILLAMALLFTKISLDERLI